MSRPRPHGLSRRQLLGAAGAGVIAVGTGAPGYAAGSNEVGGPDPRRSAFDFEGRHQAGIVTPAQDRLHFAAFEDITDSREELVTLLPA